MKAVVCTKYGPPEVLKLKEMPKPMPKDKEVCIKNFATAVTGSDVLIRGADRVIDYTKEDFAGSQEQYDFILDAVPNGKIDRKKLKAQCKKALLPNGKSISIDDGSPKLKAEYLVQINELFEAGNLKAVIDRTYSLEQIVEAHTYVDTGRKKGNVVITVGHNRT